jgi:exodeoxyribonuclease V
LNHVCHTDLSPDQLEVYNTIVRWTESGQTKLLTVGGLAGSGKSTLLGLFAARCTYLRVAYICFTGRASSNLRKKLEEAGVRTTRMMQTDDERALTGKWGHLFYARGAPESKMPFCDTAHRLLYRPVIDSKTEELKGWEKRATLDRDYDLIVIDEGSMVGDQLLNDIQAHGVRILAVGDHGQLPPVKARSTLMTNPHLRLEKIHRQAEASPIIRLAHAVRQTGRFDSSLADGVAVCVRPKGEYEAVLREVAKEPILNTAVLCWKHKTRVMVNRKMREILGHDGKPPLAGEPVLALRNYPPVYNGMRGLLTEDAAPADDWWQLRVNVDFPGEGVNVRHQYLCQQQFHRLPPRQGTQATFGSIDELKEAGITVNAMSEAGKLYDFGYAMTIHRSQGSQFDHVVVCVDWPEGTEDARKFAYTAATRAVSRLTVLR